MKKNAGVLLLATLATAFSACVGFAAVKSINNNEPEVVNAAEGSSWNGLDTSGNTYGSSFRSALQSLIAATETIGSRAGYSSSTMWSNLAGADEWSGDSTKIRSFYVDPGLSSSDYFILKTNHGGNSGQWNKEHVWPNSRGAGTTGPGNDPQMLRAAAKDLNGSRGNLMYAASGAYDPSSEGYAAARGEAARIIFYTATYYYGTVNGTSYSLQLTNNVGDSTSNNTMGKLSDLITWNNEYPVTAAETYRNEYLDNLGYARNPYIDHPDWANYIWDSNGIRTSAYTPSTTSPSLSVASSTATLAKGSSTTVQATASNFTGTVTFSQKSSSTAVATATVSSSGLVTITGVKGGSATITITATDGTSTKTATIAVTVTSSDPTLTVSSSTASVKTSATTSVTLTASNFSGTPTYSVTSSNSTIATGSVSGTTLTISGVAVGSATLTITATSGSDTASTTVAVTVTDASAYTGTYHLVTSTSDLVAGKKYLIASAGAAGSASFLSTSITGTYYQGITSNTINSDLSVTPSSTTEALTLGGSADSWTFTTSVRSSNSGMLCVSGTYQNLVAVASPTSTDYSTWSIAVGSGNAVTIKNTADTDDRYIEYYSSKSEFTTYATASTVYLFVENGATPAKTLSSIAKTGTPTTTSYTAGQSFDPTGVTVTATYSDGSTADVTSSVTWTPSPLTAGTTSVTGTYGGKTVTVSGLTVAAATKTLSSIAVTTQPTKSTYTVGDSLDTSGLVVTATYSDDSTADVTGYTLSPANGSTLSTVGSQTVTVTYSGKTTTFAVTVNSASSGGSGNYQLVTSVASLSAGDKVAIASTNDGSGYAMSSTQNSNNRGRIGITVSSNEFAFVSGMEEFTLGGSSDAWTFFANNSETQGYLYAASSSKNYLRTQTENDSNGQWTISITGGVASIVANGSYTHNTMQYNSNSSSGLFFSCYSSASQNDVYLYKQAAGSTSDATLASQWAAGFVTALGNVCANTQANTTASTALINAWASEYTAYGNLASAVQNLINSSATSVTDASIIAARAKYTYILNKYGVTPFASGNYLSLTINSGAYKGETLSNSSESTAILVVASMMAAGLTGFYLLKKKKAI
jgi:hypothetical protein